MEHAAALVDSLSTPLLVVERQGAVRYANPAAGGFWRSTPGRLRESTVQRLFAGDERLPQAVVRAVDDEASSTVSGLRLEGAPEHDAPLLRAQVDPVLVPGQPVHLAIIVLWDETRHARAEFAASEQQRMQALGTTVRQVAHELQNPLSGIKGATQLLARGLARSPELAEFPAVILKELERLERLIRNMLGYGADPPLTPSQFNLHALLDEVLWFIANSGADVHLVREYDPSLPDLWADRDRMHQVFLNLIGNAVEANPPGGTVRVRTEVIGPWQERETLPEPTRTYFRIEVEDQGPGVAEADRPRLFTPFFTTRRTGNGLGLAISYQLVRAHEGTLRYRPATDGGAVFTVLLPLAESGLETGGAK